MTITLTTNGPNNHPVENWAMATARIIFDASALPAASSLHAIELQGRARNYLTRHYQNIIDAERDGLRHNPQHCDTPYKVNEAVDAALVEMKASLAESPWAKWLTETWSEAARATIASHLLSAAHVERLLYADAHPENASAVAYQRSFHAPK